jgi:hypothetical protein
MQHNRTFHDMTFTALSKRADEAKTLDAVSDYIGGDDLREVTVFLTHEQIGWHESWRTVGKEIIGVALADLDDPQAPVEILDRSQAMDLFGWRWIEDQEAL